MANELKYLGDPASDSGLTITCKVYTAAGVQQGADVSCTEVGLLAFYQGNMPSAGAGVYFLRFYDGATLKATGKIAWDGSAEKTILDLNDVSDASVADAVWDELLTGGSHNIQNSAGRRLRNIQDFGIYDMASVWVDEINGTSTGIINGEDATVTNRANDFDNAQTVADSVGLTRIVVTNNNSITLSAALEGYEVYGPLADINFNGQNVGGTLFIHFRNISGTALSTASRIEYELCDIIALTTHSAAFRQCGFFGTLTLGEASDYFLIDCCSEVAGTGAPTLDMGAAIAGSNVSFRRWSGGLTINNMAAGDVVSLDLVSGGTITINGTGGTVAVRGLCNITDNSGGAVTIIQLSAINMDKINAEVDTALGDYDSPTNAEMVAAFTEIKGATFDGATDSLEAIRNQGDAAWITGGGDDAATIAAAVWAAGVRTLTSSGTLTPEQATQLSELHVVITTQDGAGETLLDRTLNFAAISAKNTQS